MTKSIIPFNEPELEFRYSQRTKDPHDGLSLFGPYDADMPSHPGSMPYILLGTKSGINKFERWSSLMNSPAIDAPRDNWQLWPPFPGFEAAFCCHWPDKPVWQFEIDEEKLTEASRNAEKFERVYSVCNYFIEGIRRAAKLDEKIGVAICVIPDEIWANCRPKSRPSDPIVVVSPHRIKSRKSGQLELFSGFNPEQFDLSPDFRRQLKARSMKHGIPLQIIRESTLRPSSENTWGERGLTPLSDRLWNLSAAIYYKCGGKPWRLVTAREGVCYIGIAFRRADLGENEGTACCAAQMFLNTGDGVVFLGDYGPWYSSETNQFHLDKPSARNLLEGVLKTYTDLGGKELNEIFLHSRSLISQEEFDGYSEACPSQIKLLGIRVRANRAGPRLFRTGTRPIIRGSFWKLNDKSGLLWGSGFKPRLGTYDGWETPVPLRIDIQHGDAPIERVAQDIFGLTKLNYNACRLGEAQPVTVGFSDAVGEILISNPAVSDRKPNFKFYI